MQVMTLSDALNDIELKDEVLTRLRAEVNHLRAENFSLRQSLTTAEAREVILRSRIREAVEELLAEYEPETMLEPALAFKVIALLQGEPT